MDISNVENGNTVTFQVSTKTPKTYSKKSPNKDSSFIFAKGEIALQLITKDSEFMRYVGSKVVQKLVKKKLKMDTGIDISELSVTDIGDAMILRLSADVEVSKTEILKLFMNSKGE